MKLKNKIIFAFITAFAVFSLNLINTDLLVAQYYETSEGISAKDLSDDVLFKKPGKEAYDNSKQYEESEDMEYIDGYADETQSEKVSDDRGNGGEYKNKRQKKQFTEGEYPISIEPLKGVIWNAFTLPKDTFVIRPYFSYTWSGGVYDTGGNFFDNNKIKRIDILGYIHYGFTDKIEGTAFLGVGSISRDTPVGSNSDTGLLDMSFAMRYAIITGYPNFCMTMGLNFVLPIGNDALTGGDFKLGPMLHASYFIEPVMLYANLGYTRRGSNDNVEYGNVFDYAFGGEYFWTDYDLSFIMALAGQISGDTTINSITYNDSGPSKLQLMPAVTYKIQESNMTLMTGLLLTLSGSNVDKTNTFFFEFQWAFSNFSNTGK